MKQISGHGCCPFFRVVRRFLLALVVAARTRTATATGSTTMVALALMYPASQRRLLWLLRPSRLSLIQQQSGHHLLQKAISTTATHHSFSQLSSLSTPIDGNAPTAPPPPPAAAAATPRRWRARPNQNHQRLPMTTTTTSTTALYGARRLSTDASQFDKHSSNNNDDDDDDELVQYYARPVVQWYPGHIAKAERQLREVLKAVDVVIEVRHARAMEATSHPMVTSWCAGRPRIVAVTHADQIPSSSQQAWKGFYEKQRKNTNNNNNNNNNNEETAGENYSNDKVPIVDRQVQNQAKQAIQERLKYQSNAVAAAAAASEMTNDQQQRQHLLSLDIPDAVLFVNAKTGSGIPALIRTIFKAGAHVQVRRARRGLQPRPLRVGIMGFPNVGKSALINRLLGRKRAKTANTPGVTRSLQWIRVRQAETNRASGSAAAGADSSSSASASFELLDSPGIIPAVLDNQDHATLLAVCNCIGNAAYDNQGVATFLCQYLLDRHRQHYAEYANDHNFSSSDMRPGPPNRAHSKSAPPPLPEAPEWRQKCMDRYKFDPLEWIISPLDGVTKVPRTGADMLYTVADHTCQGDPEDAARKVLQDFRTGRMGPICLQLPWNERRLGQHVSRSAVQEALESIGDSISMQEKQDERTRITMELAQERGIELPPSIWHTDKDSPAAAAAAKTKDMASSSSPTEVGKGLFDGW